MYTQHRLAFFYSLIVILCPLHGLTVAQLTRIQLSDQSDPQHSKKDKIKKKERIQFEHAYSLKKEEKELFEQSYSQAPAKLKAVVNEMIHKTEVGSKFKAILLTGPSGSGKTVLAQSVAYRLGRSCEIVHAPSLLGHFRDQAAEKVKDLFRRLRKDPRKPALVLDEINALTDDHTSEHSDTKHTAMQLWTCIDKYKNKKNFLLIGTTNITKKMPHQLQSRFEGKTFIINNPEVNARKQALYLRLKEIKIDESCNEKYLAELAQKMADFSQREIEALVDDAAVLAGMDTTDLSKRIVSKKHLEQAYEELISQKDKLWDFKEQTTEEERRHRENREMNERHFKESQEFQLIIAEWHMIYNAIIKDKEIQSRIPLKNGIEAINESKKIVFPDKKSAAKIKELEKPGYVFKSGKYAVIANNDKEKQESAIQLVAVKGNHESK